MTDSSLEPVGPGKCSLPAGSPQPWKWWTIVSVCLATFMLIAFIMILPIGLPDLQRDLGASFGDLQWVVNAYTLPLAALLLVGGAIADRIGRKRVFVAGLMLAIMGAASATAAPNTALLLPVCAALGIGAAMMLATSLALISHAYVGQERTEAFGLWGTSIALALALGPLGGGFLVSLTGWRGVFALTIPICGAALAIALLYCEESKNELPAKARLDWGGAITLCGMLFALIYALTASGGERSGAAASAGIACAVLLVAFIITELRLRDNPHRPPILDLGAFLSPTLSGAAIVAASMAFANFGLTFYVTIFFANVQHDGPVAVGLKLLSITGASVVASWAAGKLLKTFPPRLLLIAAMALIVAGDVLLAVAISPSGWLPLIPGFVLVGMGAGALNPPLGVVAVAAMPPEQGGVASGINNTFRQIGTALGIALLGAVFQAGIGSDLVQTVGVARADVVALVASGRFDQAATLAGPNAVALSRHAPGAFASALRELFVIMACVAAAGMASAAAFIRPTSLQQ
jgi:MFS family permease